jgi:transposase
MDKVVRKQYTKEFKREAVELVKRQQYSITQAANSLGLNRNMLDRWCREYEARHDDAFPGTGNLPSANDELQRLRDENQRLKMEREILKKAAAFFAMESG